MADAKRTIDLIFNGIDNTGKAVDSALQNTERFGKSVESATQPIADFTQSALKFEAAVLTVGAALTGVAIQQAAQFESSLADLNKVLGDNENLEEYAELARQLSVEFGESSSDIVQSIANYKQAGFTAKEAGLLTEEGLKAVIAGNLEAARASDLLVASIKGFGAEASDSTAIVDLLNETSNQYAASFDQLLEGFAQFSPVADAVGLSLQETIGILTPGIEVFRSGSEVANALRRVFTQLTGDTKPVADALKSIGVSQRDANGELRSGRDIYFDVADALQTVDQNQKLYIASQLVGSQRAAQFIAVVDGLDKSLRIAGEGFEFAGSAAREVEIQLQTAERAFARVGASIQNLFIDLGEPLLDDFAGLGDALVEVFETVAANLDKGGLADLTVFIEEAFQGAEDTLRRVAINLPAALEQADFSGFQRGLEAIADGVQGLFGDLDPSSVEGIVTVIESIGGAFNGLSQFTAGALESFQTVFNFLVELGRGAGDAEESIRSLGRAFGFTTQINALAGGLQSLATVATGLATVIGLNQSAGLVGAFSAAGTALSGQTGLLALLGKAGLVGAAGAAGVALGTLLDKSVELATDKSLSDRISDWLTSFTDLDEQAKELERTLELVADPDISGLDEEFRRIGEEIENTEGKVFNFSSGLSELDRSSVGTLNNLEAEWLAIQKATEATTAATGQLVEETEKISLDEKLAIIEANAALASSSIEANAQVLEAAFTSIGESVAQTGENLTSLFGLLGDDNISKFDKLSLKEQIREENERLEKQLRIKERLYEAQIREINLRAEAYRNGGALINIDGAGLQPHLEAFMFEILEAIQVRVNAEGYNLLLGADT